ncbi:T-cell activation inhibitor, mitochondrial [Agrilus planipennis]|uniref:T-cell activation inhibitor, mitochondrial n=1 Tax=Agrilus planipennis TaxID=224129 RepID=A0A1W4WSN9_AGRPL|nr:T-cell activation inhibitor, mitochondrial [Agrilus planipennis]
MFCQGIRQIPRNVNLRYMTTTEVSTALRPFYFSVHPDLFGQYPSQRMTNETSLQQLSSFIECLQKNRPVKPVHLKFYVREKNKDEGLFKLVNIQLNEKDIRSTVTSILQSLKLSTKYVDGLPKTEKFTDPLFTEKKTHYNVDFTNIKEDDPLFGMFILKKKIDLERESNRLRYWLEKNYKVALDKSKTQIPVRSDIKRLRNELIQKWGLQEVRWDCGWNEQHFKGCLQALMALGEQHPQPMQILKGRILVFAGFTGVSLDGHIMLNSGEVRHNWLDLLHNVKKYDKALLRIPLFEKCVSQVLRDIKIGRRKFMPKILAEEYENNLKKITTALNDYLSRRSFPKEWPKTLKEYELVVDSESGPLMLSHTGQIMVPASCPGVLMVNFITRNLEEAAKKMEKYKTNQYLEQSLQQKCIDALHLTDLFKDDSVSPDVMIECCQRLLKFQDELQPVLKDVCLHITNYYSVLSDGVVCIPWNWAI